MRVDADKPCLRCRINKGAADKDADSLRRPAVSAGRRFCCGSAAARAATSAAAATAATANAAASCCGPNDCKLPHPEPPRPATRAADTGAATSCCGRSYCGQSRRDQGRRDQGRRMVLRPEQLRLELERRGAGVGGPSIRPRDGRRRLADKPRGATDRAERRIHDARGSGGSSICPRAGLVRGGPPDRNPE